MTTALHRLITWPLFLLPFLPFYISWSLPFPYITGRSFLFRLLIEIAFCAWLALICLDTRYVQKLNTPLVWILAAFLLIVGLANTLGLNPNRSFWSTYERMEGYIGLLHVSALLLILASVFTNSDWTVFFDLFVLSGLLVSISTFSPIWKGGGLHTGAVFGNPTFLASYLLLTGGLAGLACVRQRNPFGRVFYLVAAGFQFSILVLTGGRAASLALACGIGAFGLFFLIGLRCQGRL